jgi:hypothetical protein
MGQYKEKQIIINKSIGPPIIPFTKAFKWIIIVEYISAAGRVLKLIIIYIGKKLKDY